MIYVCWVRDCFVLLYYNMFFIVNIYVNEYVYEYKDKFVCVIIFFFIFIVIVYDLKNV